MNFQRPPWLETGAVSKNQLAGRLLHRPTGRGVAEDSVKVGYRFDLTPARGRGGNLSGVALATPILDDVTLTYFLPSTQILLWEDLPVDYEALAGAKAQRRSRSPGQ